ncbi:M4 family metallopeptidase [Archangium violaceum]|uniref:M4 family metallopeptidase n=1 Tax=Archangium violaceum TaxID=83451 RepID=UPI00193C6D40|nr:M4 family metallopeptidase [Archangium violaceum]QRK12614.1 M4 family metallopeptidase [Archangium violaceum]
MRQERSSRRALLLACALPLATTLNACSQVSEEDLDSRQEKLRLLNQLTTDSQGEERIGWNAEKGIPTFVFGKLSDKKASNALDALRVLEEKKALFDMQLAADELTLESQQQDEYGRTFKFKQRYKGIPVFGRELVVNTDLHDDVRTINGHYEPVSRLDGLNTRPGLSQGEAVAAAKEALGLRTVQSFQEQSAELNVYRAHDGSYHLAYVVSLATLETEIPFSEWVFVDAHGGTLLHRIPRLESWAAVGSGSGLGGVTRTVNSDYVNGIYEMRDLTRGARIETHDANRMEMPDSPIATDEDNLWASNPDAVDVHAFTGLSYDYFKNKLGRDSFDDHGRTVKAYANFGTMANAYYDTAASTLHFGPEWGRLDIVGHEYTHGVVAYTARLIYEAQSGALNESWADVFGELIDDDDQWLIGEDLPNGAIRSLRSPSDHDDPAHMSDYLNLPIDGDNDLGGVHSNSGIPNRAFYLVATAPGVTKDQAGQIWYRALKNYMTSTSQFSDARMATIQAANDLFGSASAQTYAVIYAWNGVGVGTPAPHDAYEPNDSLTAAHPISADITYSSKISSESDVDYFRIEVDAGTHVRVDLTQLPADYNLQLIHPTGSAVGMSGAPGTGNEWIDYTAAESGTYWVKVSGYGGAYDQSNAYALRLTLNDPTPPPATDLYEPNDSRSAAYPLLPNLTYRGLIDNASDVDYFRIELGAGAHLRADLTQLPANYNLQLIHPTGSTVGMSGAPGTGNEWIDYTVGESGTYWVKILGYNGAYDASSAYALKLTVTDPPPSWAIDPYEPNDSLTTAHPISAGTTYTSKISRASDVDYFRIELGAGAHLRVDLTQLPANYNLQLIHPTGSTVGMSGAPGTGNEWIDYTVGESGTYWVKVLGYNGAFDATADYTLKATLTAN